MSQKIEYVDYGLANIIDDRILLHRKLQDHKLLHDIVLEHELRHLAGEKRLDWREPFHEGLFWFVLLTPSTWVHFLPVWIRGRRVIYSKTMLALWLFVLSWVGLLVVYAKWIL